MAEGSDLTPLDESFDRTRTLLGLWKMRCRAWRHLNIAWIRRYFVLAVLISLGLMGYYSLQRAALVSKFTSMIMPPRLKAYATCVSLSNGNVSYNTWDALWQPDYAPKMLPEPKSKFRVEEEMAGDENYQHRTTVLVIPKTSYSSAFKSVSTLLTAHRIKYKMSIAGKNLPDLIKPSKGMMGKFGVIVFEDLNSYLQMDKWNREILDKYCTFFKVGIVGMVWSSDQQQQQLFDKNRDVTLPLQVVPVVRIRDLTVSSGSSVLRLVKGSRVLAGESPTTDWVAIQPGVESAAERASPYSPVLWGLESTSSDLNATYNSAASESSTFSDDSTKRIIVLQDDGSLDGIPKVLFGGGISKHWLNQLLFLDALSWLSHKRIQVSLTRFIQIDIDDIFVGKYRLTTQDVLALLQSQNRIRRLVPGFRYNLGFSGGFFKSGSYDTNLGDDLLLQHRHQFWWFPHMFRHEQPHKFDNVSALIEKMQQNKQFAMEHDLPVNNFYSIAPHHSGVYPVHEPLYEAWKAVWDIQVTATEEYPHLRPAHLRKGFIHRGIAVLPRQTCGLFTNNILYDSYPNGGPQTLEQSIRGGELFQTVVNNPVSIFMTHMPNYGSDRLAPYTFESVLGMLRCWTNLDLKSVAPVRLSQIYFDDLFPEERIAEWGDPCQEKRHKMIWSKAKSCQRLPNFLVIGPQKTGTTALYSFLQLHPSIESNVASADTFEEVQFFSGSNYIKGIDWYMQFFPDRSHLADNSSHSRLLFEKSANYFDRDLVPSRAHRLLPNAKLIVILISPAKRAYSWYHHQRAHSNPVALNYSFHQVITAVSSSSNSSKALRALQSRCLEPGKYVMHIERWLGFFNSQAMLIVDGDELKYDPVSVMNHLQHFLNVKPILDYSQKLRFNVRKGFYCMVNQFNGTECLGEGKGRRYPPMDAASKAFLRSYYRLHNEALLKLLKRLGYSIPKWLEEELNDSHTTD